MSFVFKKCPIAGLYEIEPKVFGDSRGFFLETYKESEFFEAGLTMKFVQDNMSRSSYGVLRGLHYQKKHSQGKLVSVVEGKVFDVAVDLRNDSETFGKYHAIVLSAEKHNMFYIPEGFAHGFVVISESAVSTYKCTSFYNPEDEYGLAWNDKTLSINWPKLTESPLLSKKDMVQPSFNLKEKYF